MQLLRFPLFFDYFGALVKEIQLKSNKDIEASSVFFGGGTPSLVDSGYICRVMDALREGFCIQDDAEITIETNPGTLNPEKLKAYKLAGINRISLGIQSLNDEELKVLGRIHDKRTAEGAFYMIREAGFKNVNTDIMMTLPGQTPGSYLRTLEGICALKPEHISAYSLIIEEGTFFYDKYKDVDNEELDRRLYHFTREYFEEHGYRQYEISNFAQRGYECRHNTDCWRRGSYLGFGIGASSYVRDLKGFKGFKDSYEGIAKRIVYSSEHSEVCSLRFSGCRDVGTYLKEYGRDSFEVWDMGSGLYDPESFEALYRKDNMSEAMILGLRMNAGVNKSAFYSEFGVLPSEVFGAEAERAKREGLLEEDEDSLRLTARGFDLANYVMGMFL